MAANTGRMGHKDLVVWQKGMVFVNQVIDVAENLETTRRYFEPSYKDLENAVDLLIKE